MPPEYIARLRSFSARVLRDSASASLELFKLMVPVIVVVKILKELELVGYLALPLKPVMVQLGLPPETGLVWASALLVNIYTGMVVYAELWHQLGPLSVAQITVLATMILAAHSLPVELRITQKCGAKLRWQLLIRMGGALLMGLALHLFFEAFDLFREASSLMWTPPPREPGLVEWVLIQARTLVYIFFIILGLMLLMRLLDALGVTRFFIRVLQPVLRLVGIGKEAATITIIGLTLGVTFGAGLMLHEIRNGRIPPRDLFASISLMNLSHGLIEDTLLMMLLGAHLAGIFWGRLILSLLLVAILVRLWSFAWIQRRLKPES